MAKGYSARNGFGGSAGMMRQQQQMQQKLAKMQQEMESAQKNVEESSFTASVGGGAVQATVSGKKQLTALTIQPDMRNSKKAAEGRGFVRKLSPFGFVVSRNLDL